MEITGALSIRDDNVIACFPLFKKQSGACCFDKLNTLELIVLRRKVCATTEYGSRRKCVLITIILISAEQRFEPVCRQVGSVIVHTGRADDNHRVRMKI